MINNTKITKRLIIGATSVLATGALLGVGAAGASAATAQPTPVAHASVGARSHHVSLVEQLRVSLFQGHIDAAKVQQLVERITGDSTLFAALPADLQSDLTSLKNAPDAQKVADATKLKTTALAGGYGDQIKALASSLQATAELPISKSLVKELRADLASGSNVGVTASKIAGTVTEHPELFSKLPANLQSDVTALKNSSAADDAAQVQKIEATAIAGGYGQQIQGLTQQITTLTGAVTK
jgi:hypothetical protein